jgi:sugar phosphate isomerase/epimerase
MPDTSPRLAMSTAWSARRSRDVGPVLDPIQALGFRTIELNSLTPRMVGQLPAELARRGMVVQSAHDPCPWPVDATGERLPLSRLPELSSLDSAERGRAVTLVRASIETARDMGARALVVHLGSVHTSVEQWQLFHLLRAGRRLEFARLRAWALVERETLKAPYVERALASVRELGEFAAQAGMELGIETRDGYQEIPSLAEFDEVFAASDGLPVYYWHDVGHAEKQRHLGLVAAGAYLQRFAGRLIGVHLHDAILDRDHLAPGTGEVDLAAVARLLPGNALRTLELSDDPTPDEVRRGVRVLEKLGLA